MAKSRAARQAEALRAILKDAIRSGVAPDADDIAELRRLGIPPATVAKVTQLADIGVEKFDSGETLTLNEANRFAEHYAETLVEQLKSRNDVSDADREQAAALWQRHQSGVRVEPRRGEAVPAHAVNR